MSAAPHEASTRGAGPGAPICIRSEHSLDSSGLTPARVHQGFPSFPIAF